MREWWKEAFFTLLLFLITFATSSPNQQSHNCKHSGQRFVSDYIQFQCFSNDTGKIDARPIGCVPSNTSTGTAILPGLSFTGEHFRYSCVRKFDDTLTLKITHCVDSSGSAVALGQYFMQRNVNGEHESMECVGDELRAKKIVFKWSKCRRKNGEQLTEGNFLTEPVANDSLRSSLQSEQIVACQREGAQVALRCTGCVATNGDHIAVSAYKNVDDQWTQCRRFSEGCRLINVTSDYVDCKHEGQSYSNGETFKSKSGHSSYICDFGVVTKQGCLIDGEIVTIGEVRYVNGAALACEHKDVISNLGLLEGCKLENGSSKKFMETWTGEDQIKRKCSWSTDSNGKLQAEILDYACLIQGEEVSLNKIVQLADGSLQKCTFEDGNRVLTMRPLKDQEKEDYLKKKTLRLNLIEYFANGGKSSTASSTKETKRPELKAPADIKVPNDEAKCEDYLPFCIRLSNYCSHSTTSETGLLIEAYEEHAKMQEIFERLSGARPDSRRPIGCEDQLTSFRKIQVFVELACQKTCRKCFVEPRRERLISNLERTAHCGW